MPVHGFKKGRKNRTANTNLMAVRMLFNGLENNTKSKINYFLDSNNSGKRFDSVQFSTIFFWTSIRPQA